MFKYLQKLLLVAALCLPWVTQAQSYAYTVANGTETNNYVPIYGFWADAAQRNQMVYPASMLTVMDGNAITALHIYMSSTASSAWGTTVTVKMTEVSDSTLTALLPTDNATVVWTGTLNGMSSTEVLYLTTPYVYMGGNLLIEFNTTAATYSSASWEGISQTGGSYYSYNSSGGVQDFLPTMTFIFQDPSNICIGPGSISMEGITSNFGRAVWNGSSDLYGILWGETDDVNSGSGTSATTTDSYFEMNNLSASTSYTIMVWSICNNGVTSDTSTYTFTTIGEAITEFPYITGFEDGDDTAWTFVNDATNQWAIGTGAAHSGTKGLYISNNNGISNAYTVSGYQFSYAYRPFVIADGGQYAVSFDWKAYGESSWDYLRAWLAPATATFTAGMTPAGGTSSNAFATATPDGWIDLGGKMNLDSVWQTNTAVASLASGGYYMVFMWANDNSMGTQPPAAIDNIEMRALTCSQPTGLTAIPHSHEVDLSWTAGGDESAWEIIISDTVVEYSQSENYTVQNLDAYTYYHFAVRAICGVDDTSFATTTGNIRTLVACPPPTALTVDSVTTSELFVSWVPGDAENSWYVTINDSVVDEATDTTYHFSDLDINTQYTIKVRALCGGEDTSSVVTVNAHTLAGDPISEFPYICGFEVNDDGDNEATAWVLENNSPNGWYVGSATNNGGSKSLYISNNNGTSNEYTNSTSCVSYAYATFDMTAGEYVYSFDWKAAGESSYDFLRAAVAPYGTATPNGSWTSSSVATGFTTVDGGYLNQQSSWQTQTGTFTIETPGVYNFYFVWRNDYSQGDNPPAAIDNFSLTRNTCPAPTAFVIDTIEAFQATLDWTAIGDESEWEVRAVSPTSTDEWQTATTHPYVYSGLNSGTSYTFQLRAVCDVEETSLIVSCYGTTVISCPEPTAFAVTVSGDTADFTWTDANGSAWELAFGPVGFSPDTADNVEHPTTNSFQMTGLETGVFQAYLRTDCGDGDYSTWVGPISVNTLPQYVMAATGADTLYTCNMTIYDCGGADGEYTTYNNSYLYVYPANASQMLQVSGYSYTEGSWDYLRITDLSTGEVLFCDNATPNGQTIPSTIAYGGVELYFYSDGSVTYDGFEVNVSCVDATTCIPVRDLEVAGVTAGAAYLTWSPNLFGDYSGAVVEYRDTVSGSGWTTLSTTDTSMILSGLSDNTYYEVRVAPNCDGQVEYVQTSFRTAAFNCVYDDNNTINATIGSGASTSSYIPSYSLYNYSYSQQFFKASEIGGSGQITRVTLTPSAITNQRTFEIYMGQSNDTASDSFITPDGLTCVYNGGQIPLVAGQPVTFELTTPFDYSDTSNLVVIFRDLTGTWSSGNSWQGDQAWSGASRYVYRDASSYDVPQTTGGTSSSFRNMITFFGGQCIGVSTCSAPAAWVTGVARDSVYLEWIPGATETSWVVYYENAGNMVYAGTATTTNYAVSGLSGSTDYIFHIGAICNGDTLMTTVNATTAPEEPYDALPFVCNFDTLGMDGYWMRVDEGQTNKWAIGTVDSNRVMMISNDNGVTNSYSVSSSSVAHTFVRLNLAAGEYFYSFDWRAAGENNYDYLLAYIVPDNFTPTTSSYSIPTGAIRIDGGNNLNQQSSWQTQSGTLDISDAGIYKMVFTWRNDGSGGTQPPAAIDNVTLVLNTCRVPANLTATVTGDAADFAWSDTTGNSWEVVYGTAGFNPENGGTVINATSNSAQATNLAEGFYEVYVRSNCGNGDYSYWAGPVSFSVGIVVMNMNAGYDTISTCNAIIYDDGGPNGNYSNSRNDELVIYPSDPNKRFKLWGSGSTEQCCDYLKIYLGDQAVGTPIATIKGEGINIDTILTMGGPITLQFHSDASLVKSGFAIFLACEDLPSCIEVTDLAVVGNTMSSITLDWGSFTGNDYSWVVSYSTTPLADPMTGTTAAVTSHPYTVTGLTAGTDYYFYVLNDCGSDSSIWRMVGPVRPGTWTMNPNQTDTLYMCGGTIYDDGGADGEYSASQNSTIILRPDTPGTLVSVSGTANTEGYYDYLTIYDGMGTNGAVLWTNYGTNNATFGPIESMSGSLTITFESDNMVQYDGFEIDVTCVSALCRVLNLRENPNATASSNQVSLIWDAATDALQYQIEYGTAGFAHGQGQMMTSTTNSAVVTGLASMTNYDFYVRSLCTGGDTGSWAHVTCQTAMCDNPVNIYNYDTTQVATTSTKSPIGYSYYDYGYVQTIIPAGRLTDLAGEVNAMAFNTASGTAGSYFTNMTVWMSNVSEDDFADDYFIVPDAEHVFYKVIDSADFSYSDAGWQVQVFDSAFTWDGVSNILVTVLREHGDYSSGATFVAHEDTVARTIYAYRDNTTYDPYGMVSGTSDEEVGDIMLISCGAGCARPYGVYATDVNYGGATLNWFGSADNYEVSVKPATVGTWPAEVAVNGATTYNATGLTPNTQYQFRVRAVCDAAEGLISDWVVGGFTTDELPCFAPTDLHVSDLGITTVTLAWNAETGQNQWSVRVWNTSGGNDYAADGNPYTVTGLAANTLYYAAVKSVCGDGAAESEYGDTIHFTTGTCPQVEGVTVSEETSSSALVSWNTAGTDAYIIEYGDENFSAGTGIRDTVEGGATTYRITGLEANNSYTVYVRAVCGDGVNGDWSRADFTTLDGEGISSQQPTANSQLSIYPNPTSDATTIAVSGVEGEVTIVIVDMNGRTVKAEIMSCNGDCTKRMEVSGLAQGAYFVRVNGEGINMVRKLVVK